MSAVVNFLKEYVVIFLIFTLVLYLLPSEQYRGYVRFFLEMVLVLFCMERLFFVNQMKVEDQVLHFYDEFLDAMGQRKKEAKEMEYLDMDYVEGFVGNEEEGSVESFQ